MVRLQRRAGIFFFLCGNAKILFRGKYKKINESPHAGPFLRLPCYNSLLPHTDFYVAGLHTTLDGGRPTAPSGFITEFQIGHLVTASDAAFTAQGLSPT